jgi:hypothetical protein
MNYDPQHHSIERHRLGGWTVKANNRNYRLWEVDFVTFDATSFSVSEVLPDGTYRPVVVEKVLFETAWKRALADAFSTAA